MNSLRNVHRAYSLCVASLSKLLVNTSKSPVMGVPVSVKRRTSYDFSIASFSTTGTLQSSVSEGQLCWFSSSLDRLYIIKIVNVKTITR